MADGTQRSLRVKYYWGLRLQASEKSALQGMLATC
jgi:hypothetical protein